MNWFDRATSTDNSLLAAINHAFLMPFVVVLATCPLNAQTTNGSPATLYRLNAESSFVEGCFPPCLCPVTIGVPVKGTFLLTPTGFNGLFYTYTVTNVN